MYMVNGRVCVVVDGKIFVEAPLAGQLVDRPPQDIEAQDKSKKVVGAKTMVKAKKERKSKVDWKVAIKRIQDGDDVRAVADDVGVTYSAVLYQLKKRGISKKTAQKQREDATARGLSMNTLHCNACDHEWDTAMNSDETVCMSCGSNSLITI